MGKGLCSSPRLPRLQWLSYCPTTTAGDHSQEITSPATGHLHISQSYIPDTRLASDILTQEISLYYIQKYASVELNSTRYPLMWPCLHPR
jgi:hypothetical protein